MSGAKETPRQKMISMMYLVLTALLALNVSVEVLDAFTTVNEGLETSNESVERKIEDYYKTFEDQYNKHPEKTADLWNSAKEIRTKTDELINFIENDIKLQLLLTNNGVTKEEILNPKNEDEVVILNPEKADPEKNRRIFYKINFENIDGKDKHDNVTNFMIIQENASVLRSKISEYRQYIISTIEEITPITNYENYVGLDTEKEFYNSNGEAVDWENKYFYHIIPPAAFSVLNEIIGEIQTTEFDAITELFKRIGAADYKFNSLEAKVFPKTTYVLQGQDYEAEIFIAASDTTRKFDAKYAKGVKDFTKANSSSVQKVSSKNGIVSIKIPTTQEGVHSFAGIVEMADPETGEIVPYPFQSSYTVAPPSATVAPTQMMILYQGLKNPISVSAPGISNDNINVSISKGKIEKDAQGLYWVEVNAGDKNTTITATTNINNKEVVLGTYEFRVKRVPSPEAKIGGLSSGKIGKDELQASGGIIPDMGDFEFGDFQYNIVSYTLATISGGDYKTSGTIKGGRFNQEVNDMIKAARKGQKLFFENIQAKGPDGAIRTLNPINIEIK